MAAVITRWLGTTAVKAKDRMFGFELTYEDDSIYVYCHEAQGGREYRSYYLVEGVIETSDANPVERLTGLVRIAVADGLDCSVDYTPVDAEGEPIGDESTITPESLRQSRAGQLAEDGQGGAAKPTRALRES
ncbi:hypothetical protein ACWIGI_35470 [Nocardia sp. NPDC055321]